MRKKRKNYTPEEKVRILKEHLIVLLQTEMEKQAVRIRHFLMPPRQLVHELSRHMKLLYSKLASFHEPFEAYAFAW